ncbi:MAG: hypothetical protein HY319_16940 [Armatimonadetes bacterium]|nr:hypothetical protein [Armatimonadota bacterium]
MNLGGQSQHVVFLGIYGDEAGFLAALVTERGRMLGRGRSASLGSAVGPCLAAAGPDPPLAVGFAGLAVEELEGLIEGEHPRWRCSPEEALMAGALAGREGVLLDCGGQAVVHGLEQGGRIRSLKQHEGSATWLAQQLRERAVAGPGRVRSAAERHLKTGSEDELLAFARTAIEMADHPGPEPECKGLVGRAARMLSDLVRTLRPRLRLRSKPAASYTGPAMFGPLLQAFVEENSRYHPELRWAPPRLPPEAGCALLAQGGMLEARRKGEPPPVFAEVGEDEWRHVSRMRQPLPEWT